MQKTSKQMMFDHQRRKILESRASRIREPDMNFLFDEAASVIAERIAVTNRSFKTCIDLFGTSSMSEKVAQLDNCGTCYPITLVNTDHSSILSEIDQLPLKAGSTGLVTSVFGLHWSNDMRSVFSQIRQSLHPDGLFMAALPGPATLQELRQCMIEAETQLYSAASLRVDPFGEVRQYGDLLHQSGFALPVVDSDVVTARYSSLKSLVSDLRAMGASLNTNSRPRFAGRDFFNQTEEIYREKFADPDGKIRATFQIIYVSGWSPDKSQQKPLKPGSATMSMAKILKDKS